MFGTEPTVLEVHIIIRKALSDALRRGLVVRNVAADAEAPRRRRPNKVMRSWTAQQLQSFLDEARSDRLFPAFWLSANTGMRRGELLGLRWGEIDFAARSLSVNRALISAAYKLHETPGKTLSSRRAVDLDATTVAVPSRWRDERAAEMGRPIFGEDYVVAAPDGEPIHPDRFSQCFRPIAAGVDVPRIRLHELRQTHATLLLKAHTPIKVVSERLGHSSPAFTMATYQHVLPGMQADAAQVFGQLLASTGFYPVEESVEAS